MHEINKSNNARICEFCKEKESIVKATFKKGGLFDDSKKMNLCANCRDNLDDDIIMEEYEKLFDLDLDSYYIVQSYVISKNCEDGLGFNVGCVIVKDNEIISTGYNKIIDGDEFKLSIHAECDAIANCSRKGISTEGSTLYCNLQPCSDCAKLIISSKIKKVVYGDTYSIKRYEIIDKESYNKRFYNNKEPVLVKFHTDNSAKMFKENNVELKYIDIYALMYELEH